MLLVSACLLGVNCRYDGENNRDEKVLEFLKNNEESVIAVCPEQLGGLPTPRKPARIQGGGEKVLDGEGKVIMRGNGDVTTKFVKGAEETLKLAKIFGVKKALLKSESPSCGKDETLKNSERKNTGKGITAALLERNGVEIISEEEI